MAMSNYILAVCWSAVANVASTHVNSVMMHMALLLHYVVCYKAVLLQSVDFCSAPAESGKYIRKTLKFILIRVQLRCIM